MLPPRWESPGRSRRGLGGGTWRRGEHGDEVWEGVSGVGGHRYRASWAGVVISDLENVIPDLEGVILIPDLAGVIPDLENVIPDLESVIPDLEGVILDLAGVIPHHESVIPNLESVILNLESVIPDLAGVIPDLENVIPGVAAVIPSLEAQSGVCIKRFKVKKLADMKNIPRGCCWAELPEICPWLSSQGITRPEGVGEGLNNV